MTRPLQLAECRLRCAGWLGEVAAPDEAAAMEKAAAEFKRAGWALPAAKAKSPGPSYGAIAYL
jgi:hypothetical protein